MSVLGLGDCGAGDGGWFGLNVLDMSSVSSFVPVLYNKHCTINTVSKLTSSLTIQRGFPGNHNKDREDVIAKLETVVASIGSILETGSILGSNQTCNNSIALVLILPSVSSITSLPPSFSLVSSLVCQIVNDFWSTYPHQKDNEAFHGYQ